MPFRVPVRENDSDIALLLYLMVIAALFTGFALGVRALTRPTVIPNPGMTAYVAPPGTAIPTLRPYGASRPIDIEPATADVREAFAKASEDALKKPDAQADTKPVVAKPRVVVRKRAPVDNGERRYAEDRSAFGSPFGSNSGSGNWFGDQRSSSPQQPQRQAQPAPQRSATPRGMFW
jgi:hypothetical protein